MTVGSTSDTTAVVGGNTVPVAEIDTVDLAQLEKGDKNAVDTLYAAASSSGWFYVELANSEVGKAILNDINAVYKNADDYFMQPREVKEKDARPDQPSTQDRGYKESQCDFTFEMSRDEYNNNKLPWPAVMQPEAERYKRFSNGCHQACETLIARLGDAMQLDPSQRFENYHRAGIESDSGLKLVYEPSKEKISDVEDNLHTDSGTLTFLFYDKWGLSAHKPGKGFGFVPPLKDTVALVNVGDSLERFSGKKLRSPKHRVTQAANGIEKRYYLSYFVRPEEHIRQAWRQEVSAAA